MSNSNNCRVTCSDHYALYTYSPILQDAPYTSSVSVERKSDLCVNAGNAALTHASETESGRATSRVGTLRHVTRVMWSLLLKELILLLSWQRLRCFVGVHPVVDEGEASVLNTNSGRVFCVCTWQQHPYSTPSRKYTYRCYTYFQLNNSIYNLNNQTLTTAIIINTTPITKHQINFITSQLIK